MRYPKGHREETHRRIVDEAARAIRSAGIDGVSIGDLMARLGLTHGGFYAHFENKDVLVAEACEHAVTEAQEELYEGTDALSRDDALSLVMRRYLSRTHRDHPEEGCVGAALGSDLARSAPVVRGTFTKIVRALAARLRSVLPHGHDTEDDALAALSTMVGAMVLARAVDEADLSDRILRAARRALTHREA
jgi:TetR/AcrR family transcriptional repressor of nem operon